MSRSAIVYLFILRPLDHEVIITQCVKKSVFFGISRQLFRKLFLICSSVILTHITHDLNKTNKVQLVNMAKQRK